MGSKLVLAFLIFGLIAPGVESACGDHEDCSSCAGATELLFHCNWCVSSSSCALSVGGSCPSSDLISKAFDCPLTPDNQYQYSDSFARTTVLPFIGASNGENLPQVQDCLDTHFTNVQARKQYNVVCDKDNNTCSAFLAVDTKNKAIILTYAGTKGTSQLLDEGGDFLFNTMEALPEVGGKVDKYYHTGYFILWNSAGIFNDLTALTAQYPGYEFWTFGHSMGGSYASIASAHVIKLGMFPSNKVKLVTFGQPRTGDLDYAVAHDNLVKYRYRVIHNHDSIPHLPYQVSPTDPPFHHRFEVWYPNDMTPGSAFQVCDRADDKACSNAVSDTSSDDHVYYFNYHLPDWYQSKCAP